VQSEQLQAIPLLGTLIMTAQATIGQMPVAQVPPLSVPLLLYVSVVYSSFFFFFSGICSLSQWLQAGIKSYDFAPVDQLLGLIGQILKDLYPRCPSQALQQYVTRNILFS
jgi:hypothetical protein